MHRARPSNIRRRLGELGRLIKGYGLTKSNLRDRGTPCLRYAEIYTLYGPVVKSLTSRADPIAATEALSLLPSDIVFAASGETAEEIGKALAYVGSEPAAVGGDTIVLRGHGQDAAYLSYALNAQDAVRQKSRLGQGQSIVHIRASELAQIEIWLPPLPQQKRIAALLGTWDEAIEKAERLIAVKEAALFARLCTVTRDADASSADDGWVRTSIGEVTDVAVRRVEWDESATYRRITVRRTCGGLALREDALGSEILTKDMYLVKSGDFVISRRQVIHGAWAMARIEFDDTHVSKEYACLTARPNRLWMPYLDWLSRTPRLRHEALRCSYGVDPEKMVLNLDWLLKTPLVLPKSVDQQRRLAAFLDTAQEEIAVLKRQRDALVRQKRGLMQKLLTGEWPLTVSESQEAAE